MNLRDSTSVAAACSVAARDSGAFVPVGKIGSDTRQYDCLVTPARVFPLGRFAFSVWCVGRVGGGPNLRRRSPPPACGEGVVLSTAHLSHARRSKTSVFSSILATSGSWEGRTSKIWTRIEAMNLVDRGSSALPRSVTAQCYDAPERAARWVDWFRLATCVSTGEPLASRWKDLFFSDPGRARWRGHDRKRQPDLTYANSFVARA